MSKLYETTKFGNPILREEARRLSPDEIASDLIQSLIKNMFFTLEERSYGVGLSAPQVSIPLAVVVIGIKPTPTLPDLGLFNAVMVNPEVVETFGRRVNMWEGCISSGEGNNTLCAKVPRHNRARVIWLDENAILHDEILEGFLAHVVQHEIDHLNGILFVDRVKDTKTYTLLEEYNTYIH